MSQMIRFVLALHNHQPIGNFTGVMEQAYQESYRPFLDVFERYPTLKIALHTSGSLMEWLASAHPEYLDRLAELVAAGKVEIIGGAYYEPILAMIPRRDRIGQIRAYTHWLEQRLDAKIRQARHSRRDHGVNFHQLHLIARNRSARQELAHPAQSVPDRKRHRHQDRPHICTTGDRPKQLFI